ncbi:MAG: precorrin-6y C5,15-methyltransferase (decarboxylating) subunit CbiE [Actinobacteria bacterium]|nr:precorrin-6y C5,15-methyltransferase (decarboxylating) subunit CbiE [Actinomycetota bacterium]
MTILKATGLSFTYDDGTSALRGIDLEIAAGEFALLLGPNGSGKTTLLHHLNRLLSPTAGQVFFRDRPLASFPEREVFSRVGLVFQDPNDQLFATTVAEDVAFGPRNLGLSPAMVEARVDRSLKQVGIEDLGRRPVHHLSFGQKRRAAIAGVLAMEPEVLLLDEPTAGLDPGGGEELMELLTGLNRDGLTVVMATHDVDLAVPYARRLFLLDQGRLVLEGEPGAVLRERDQLERIGLRPHRVARLFERMESDREPEPGVYVVGLGPGGLDYLTPAAGRLIARAEVLVGGRRALSLFPEVRAERKEIRAELEEVIDFIRERENRRVVVLVSGDPGLYSFLDYLLRHWPGEKVQVIPGVSSMQLAFARARLPWHDARIISLHGRDHGILLQAVREHPKVAAFTDPGFPPREIARYLCEHGFSRKKMTVAENLSYPWERVVTGPPEAIARQGDFENAVVVICDDR